MDDQDFRDRIIRELAKQSAEHAGVKEDIKELRDMLQKSFDKQHLIDQSLTESAVALGTRVTILETKAKEGNQKGNKALVVGLLGILGSVVMGLLKLLGVG